MWFSRLWVSCLCPLVFFLTITFDVNWLNPCFGIDIQLFRYIVYSNLQFPVNVIINKAKGQLPRV